MMKVYYHDNRTGVLLFTMDMAKKAGHWEIGDEFNDFGYDFKIIREFMLERGDQMTQKVFVDFVPTKTDFRDSKILTGGVLE